MKKVVDKRNFIVRSIIAILALIAGWAFFNLVRIGAEKLLLYFGIESEALQMIIIIAFVALVFLLLGVGFRKTFKRITGV